jgi:hypothetical protein
MVTKAVVLALVIFGGAAITVAVDKYFGISVGALQSVVYMLWGAAIAKSAGWMFS